MIFRSFILFARRADIQRQCVTADRETARDYLIVDRSPKISYLVSSKRSMPHDDGAIENLVDIVKSMPMLPQITLTFSHPIRTRESARMHRSVGRRPFLTSPIQTELRHGFCRSLILFKCLQRDSIASGLGSDGCSAKHESSPDVRSYIQCTIDM